MEVAAVHEARTPDLLESLGVEFTEGGLVRCAYCGNAVDVSGIAGVRQVDGEIRISCNALTCLEAFSG